LKDSGAELLLGDFSDNGNEQVPMGGKNSSSNLERRQNRALIAGTLINLRRKGAGDRAKVRTCTLGFAVTRTHREFGYLTSGACSSNRAMSNQDSAFVVGNNAEEIIVGSMLAVYRTNYKPENGLDYAIIKVEPNY